MNIYGHAAIVGSLQNELPPVSLFVGPRSVGKRTCAEVMARHHQIEHVVRVSSLTAESARMLAQHVNVAPPDGRSLAIVRLGDHTEQRIAQNILLKALEEPQPGHHFILLTHDNPAETIASRAMRFDFGLLPVRVIERVLRELGTPEHEVEQFSRQCGGRVGEALRMAELLEKKALVVTAMRAIENHDPDALTKCADAWTPGHTETAVAWCYESIIGRTSPRLFSRSELGDMPRRTATRILIALREMHRPRLTVRGSLLSVLEAGN